MAHVFTVHNDVLWLKEAQIRLTPLKLRQIKTPGIASAAAAAAAAPALHGRIKCLNNGSTYT